MEQEVGKKLFSQKQYIKMMVANIINRFGDAIDAIALTWLIYEITGSGAWSAIIFGVNRIPTVFLTPFAGPIVEEMDKKKTMIVMDLVRGACVGIIATTMILGCLNKWLLLGITLVISSAEAFRTPASQALLPDILEERYYEKGISVNNSISSTVELMGTGVAGFIIAVIGVSGAIYIDMITFILSALVISFIKVKQENKKAEKLKVTTYLNNLKEGIKYLKENALLRYLVIYAVFVNGILVPFNALQAPIVKVLLGTGEEMLSILGVGIALGMILGAATYTQVVEKLGKKNICRVGTLALAVYYISFVLEGCYIKSAILLYTLVVCLSLFLGFAVAWLNCLISIEFMKNVEKTYLARVAAIFTAGGSAIMPITSFITSALSSVVSVEWVLIITCLFDLAVFAILCSKKKISVLA